jgi:hypothetical protein
MNEVCDPIVVDKRKTVQKNQAGYRAIRVIQRMVPGGPIRSSPFIPDQKRETSEMPFPTN